MLQGQEQNQPPSPRSSPEAAPETRAAASRTTLFVVGDPTQFDPILESLGTLGLRAVRALDELAGELRQDTNTHAVIIYPNPVLLLGGELESGQALGDAIRAWVASVEGLLAEFRRDRRRITLFDGHAALRAPALMGRLLGSRLALEPGFSERLDTVALASGSESASESAGVSHLIAAQALRQDEAASALFAELEASSLPLGPAYRIDVGAIVGNSPDGEERYELAELREENERLLQQLHQVQEELEAYFLENRKLKNEQGDESAEVKQARLARDSLKAEFKEAREAWAEERKALTDKLKWTADDLAAVRRSLSWRLTAPLRRMLGLFVGNSKL